METARIMRSVLCRSGTAFVLCLGLAMPLQAQEQLGERPSGLDTWLELQAIPSMMVISHPGDIPFAFEWEATPVLYSFAMTKLVSPWHSFKVVPPARFTGSIELKVTGQISTRKTGSSYFGSSAQLIGHIPLLERGEYLGLKLALRSTHSQVFLPGSGLSAFPLSSDSLNSTLSTVQIPRSGWAR